MATLGRAAKIITLLFGFYLLCLLLLAGMIALDVLAFDLMDSSGVHAPKLAITLLAATVGVFVVVVRGLFVSVRVRRKDLSGVPVSRAEQPELWRRVTALADVVGTRAPAEIRLVPEVNAAVLEHAHLMGLLPGKRRMMIGVPLLQALTVPELEAVLAHELGHYSDRHSRLAPLAGRARAGVMATMAAVNRQTGRTGKFHWPGSGVYAALFHAYAVLVLKQTFAISREQEYAADRIAATVGGRENAASALRRLPATDAAYEFYLNQFIGAGLRNKLVPPPAEVLGGFGRFLTDPERVREMAALGDPDDSAEAHAFDSHPPIADRIAAIRALPDDGRPPAATDRPESRAIVLLSNPAAVLTALGVQMLGPQAEGAEVADWDTIARTARMRGAGQSSQPIVRLVGAMLGRPARFTDFLALVEAGRLPEILDRMDNTETALKLKVPPPAQREFKKNALGRMLAAWALSELVPSGRATIRHSWSGFGGEVDVAGVDGQALNEGVEALLTMWPDTALLRQVVPV